jgi:diguanylate cyclase (GGDEF)-like protein/PAS domain S-box-containing protein
MPIRTLFVPTTASSTTWWGHKLMVVLTPAVLLLAGIVLVGLNTYADAYRRGEVALAQVKSSLEHLSAVDAEATVASGLTPGATDELADVEDDLATQLSELTNLAVPERGFERVHDAIGRYQATVEEHLALLEEGDVEGAGRVRTQATALADIQADAAIDGTIEAYAHEAEFANRLASIGSLLMLLLAGGSIAGLLIRSGRAAAGAARSAGEQAALLASEARFRALVQNGSEVILIVDAAGLVQYCSPSVTHLLGIPPEAFCGADLMLHVHPDDGDALRRLLTDIENASANHRESGAGDHHCEIRLRKDDGAWLHTEFMGRDSRSDPAVQGIVFNARDLTARKVLENELAHRAYHDTLTELPNRALLEGRLSHGLARAARTSRFTAILFIDLDDFKLINDTLGHQAGDELLVTVAQRLRAGSRAGDTPARLGGDEFVMLLEDLESPDASQSAAARLLELLAAPVRLAGRDVSICASVGIAVSEPGSPTLASDMFRQADVALYVAKARGKGQYATFDESMNQQPRERLEVQADLRRALDHGELRLHYQTIVELETGKITGVEALVRWEHPERGLIPPAQFIPVAEESGLIVPIGRWVLNVACAQAEAWRRECTIEEPLVMSVNLSARQFQHPGLLDEVAGALRESGLPAHLLKLEITESAAMEAGVGTISVLQALKGLGVRLAIDDFGTGYSSLAYLKRFPVDTLKIDRMFVEGLGKDPQDTAIVQSVMKLAQTLNLTVTAEGIETADQMEQLRSIACAEGQGYLFARPVPRDALDQVFAHRDEWRTIDHTEAA